MPRHISYSFLHLLACPYSAFLRYEAAIKGPTTPWLALGNAVHHALEHGHPEGVFSLDVAMKLFKKELARIIDEEHVLIAWPQVKKIEAEGLEMIGGYNAQIISGELSPQPLVLEKEFSLPFEDIQVVGRIDKIERDDGYIITDFKTGKAAPTEWFLKHNLQLTAYAWACLEIYGELPSKVVWHHLRNGKLLESTRTMADIDDLKQLISNAIKMRNMGMRHRIFHEKVCGMCDYMGDTCDDKELEQEAVATVAAGSRMEPRIVIKERGW